MNLKKSQKKQGKSNKKENRIEKLEAELIEMTEMAKRAMADMKNIKRRFEDEKIQIFSLATAEIIKQLLPIIDNIQLALKHAPNEKWSEGIKMSLEQLKETFKKLGLTEIRALSRKFDPDLHEAIAQGPGKKDMIVEVFEKGYKLGDRLIRHAKVKVGTGEEGGEARETHPQTKHNKTKNKKS